MHPKRWSSKRVGRLTPRVGPEGRRQGLSSKGRAYGTAGAVRARAKRGRSARAQAGAGGREGAPPTEHRVEVYTLHLAQGSTD